MLMRFKGLKMTLRGGVARVKLVKAPSSYPTDRSMAVHMLQFVLISSLSLFLWCRGRAVRRVCGISWVSSYIFLRNKPMILTNMVLA